MKFNQGNFIDTTKLSKRQARREISSLVTAFIGLAYEGISGYLHEKRQKAFVAMENKVNLE